jgi:16S rRNA (guanine527-N7)-methyltransferase
MGSALPALRREEFLARLGSLASLPDGAAERLWIHYQELRRWNPTVSLVGPGTASQVVERHYGEALAALPFLAPGPQVMVDAGSGAGFPGWVLAACRPDLDVTLVESNARKWAFLSAASRKAALPGRCLNARLELPLPEGLPAAMDLLTARALKLDAIASALDARLRLDASILFWAGGEDFSAPPGWTIRCEAALAGSAQRRIVELRRK